MRTARFFCDTINQNGAVIISDIQFRHIARVLRLKQGDMVELFDGKGTVAQAIIEKIAKDSALLKVQDKKIFDSENRRKIIIAASIAKAHKFELIIAKCTELGIDRIIPVIFQRTVKQADSEMSARRFEAIAVESAKQCGRIFLPLIDKPLSFEKALENLRTDFPKAEIIFGSLEENAGSIINFDFEADVIAFIGPEGGLTEVEENLLLKVGAKPLRLTDTILRIETAAIAFASILAANRAAR
ncbi:MAG: RsmE family RNA methyltransferase [Phycisphaerae bacterium]|nr:RsmE family RNA methyltransferase [Phycisphaerae bacterium]